MWRRFPARPPTRYKNFWRSGGGGGAGGVAQNNLQVSTNQLQWQLSNSRVVGTAVIDHTNQIEINAVPVTP